MYHVRLCKAPIAGLPKAKGLQNACHRHILDLRDSAYQARSDVVIVGRGPSIATVMSQQTWPIEWIGDEFADPDSGNFKYVLV